MATFRRRLSSCYPCTLAPIFADSVSAEALLHVLLHVSLTGVTLFRPVYADGNADIIDLAYVHLNPAAQQLLQLPECPAESFLTLYPHARSTGVFDFYRNAFLSGQIERQLVNYQHDGINSDFHLVAQRHESWLVVSFTDTNEHPRTAVEETLRQSEAREQKARAEAEQERNLLQAVLKQAPVAIGLFQGDECVVTAANDQLCAMWGHTSAQILSKPLLDGVPELRGQGFTELMQQVASTRVPFIGTEVAAELLDQGKLTTHYFNFVYQPLYDTRGDVLGIIDIAIDVTEQVLARRQVQELNQQLEVRVAQRTQQTEAALREAEHQREQLRVQQGLLRQILREVPAAIATLSGSEHRFSFFNDQYYALSADRTKLGETVANVFPEVVDQGFIELLDSVYNTGQPFVGVDMPITLYDRATGQLKQRFVDFAYQPLVDGQNQPQGILAFIVDVTDKVKARQQVQTLNEELAAINEKVQAANEELATTNNRLTRTNTDLDTFVYTASHDLKTPITNIEGLLAALEEQLPDTALQAPLVTRILSLMQDSIIRFQQTIAHLTDIAQLQQPDTAAETVELATLIEDVRLDLAPLLLATTTQLTIDIAECQSVQFAPKTLRSIVYNLLSNAVKYRAPGRESEVILRCHRSPGRIVLEVQDNGLGLTEAQQAKLFSMFRRLHTHVEGSGVGLYMVKRLIENSGGTITVQSSPGVGSTFTVSLPG